MSSKLKLMTINFFQALSGKTEFEFHHEVIMFISGFILIANPVQYLFVALAVAKKKQTKLGITYNASVNSTCYHPTHDLGASDQNFCLGQRAGHLT